jgi:hypothetical protein
MQCRRRMRAACRLPPSAERLPHPRATEHARSARDRNRDRCQGRRRSLQRHLFCIHPGATSGRVGRQRGLRDLPAPAGFVRRFPCGICAGSTPLEPAISGMTGRFLVPPCDHGGGVRRRRRGRGADGGCRARACADGCDPIFSSLWRLGSAALATRSVMRRSSGSKLALVSGRTEEIQVHVFERSTPGRMER